MKTINIKLSNFKEKIKSIRIVSWIAFVQIMIMVLICYVHALGAAHVSDFVPINGTFQNYNPVRRLFSGQVVFRDFEDYLGLGHLWVGSIFTWLFGGTYNSSLIAFSFLTILSFSLMLASIGYVVTKNKNFAYGVTNIFLVFLLVQPDCFTSFLSYDANIRNSINSALNIGVSARLVRGLCVPIVCFIINYILKIKDKISGEDSEKRQILIKISLGIVAGISFLWSNDHGISAWLCLSIVCVWYELCTEKKISKILRDIGIFVLAMVSGFILFGSVFTQFNLGKYISSLFSVGGYQAWYYSSEKAYYIYDIDTNYLMLFQALICIVYLVLMKIGKKENATKYFVLAFVNMEGFCVANEYRIMSGGYLREVALIILFSSVLWEILNLIKLTIEKINIEKSVLKTAGKTLIVGSTALSVAFLINASKDEFIFYKITPPVGDYFEELGGYNISLCNDLRKAQEFLKNDKVFATYASAQEVISDSFQPSGIDYIIHALGDETRQKYMDAFHNCEYKYVATINESYSGWEWWITRANWFFYRELFNDWHPCFSNSYEVYWEKNNSENTTVLYDAETSVEIEKISDCQARIILKTDENINGIADVKVCYNVTKKDTLGGKLTFRTLIQGADQNMISQFNIYDMNMLKGESSEYIPIHIVNGYGDYLITSEPSDDTFINVDSADVNCIYTYYRTYVAVNSVDSNDEKSVLTINNRNIAQNAVKPGLAIEYGDTLYNIINIEYPEDNEDVVYVTVDGIFRLESKNWVKLVEAPFTAFNFTNEDWTNGINNVNPNVILIENTTENLKQLQNASALTSQNQRYNIVSVECYSEWIWLTVDRDATACGYPSVLTVE